MVLVAGAVPGCALQPLYAGGQHGAVGTTLASISVAPISGEAGWLVRGALRDRLRAAGDGERTRYRIDVRLDDEITGFGVRTNDSITRERRTLRARWQLVDSTTGQALIDDSAGSDAGIDAVGSEYATIAAERSALERLSQAVADQIVARIAVYARNPAAAPTVTPAPTATATPSPR
ncbi:MAG: LPS assembly lipoprotein LptE [Sphingopyxis sp.]